MNITYYPNEVTVKQAISEDIPLLMLVSHDCSDILLASVDDSFEHSILLRKLGIDERKIDNYFRVSIDSKDAQWTFVCPRDYKNIPNEEKRIVKFFEDGVMVIKKALKLINYNMELTIPNRFRRHLDKIQKDLQD